jgi:predicted  nucleic acid-binding Zn-ribbon protein
MSKAASQNNQTSLQRQIDKATTVVRAADHQVNLLEARARGTKAGIKAAKKAHKLAKKAVRKAAKAAKKAHKELRSLVKQANRKPGKAKPAVKVKAKGKAVTSTRRRAKLASPPMPSVSP